MEISVDKSKAGGYLPGEIIWGLSPQKIGNSMLIYVLNSLQFIVFMYCQNKYCHLLT